MTNSYGNTNRDVRKFLREHFVKPTAGNVEKYGREIRRTETENERVISRAKEIGGPSTVDAGGDAKARAVAYVQRQLAKRKRP